MLAKDARCQRRDIRYAKGRHDGYSRAYAYASRGKKKETSAKHTASGCYVCGCKKHTWHMTMQYFNQLVAKIFEYLAKIKLQRMNEHLHTMCGAAVYVKHKY